MQEQQIRNLLFRPMRSDDLPDVLQIEHETAAFDRSHTTANHFFNHYQGFVIEKEQQIIAYLFVSLVVDEAELLHLAVKSSEQGKGIGRYCLEQLFNYLTSHQIKSCFLEVRASNVSAIKLYETVGFERVGRRVHYYPTESGREDALLYRKLLNLA